MPLTFCRPFFGRGLSADAYLPGARLLRDNHVCTVDLNALLRNGDFSQNVWIKPRDVIFAPRKEDMSVYVLGAVGSPQFVAHRADGRTLLQILPSLQLVDGILTPINLIQNVNTN